MAVARLLVREGGVGKGVEKGLSNVYHNCLLSDEKHPSIVTL